MVVFVAGSDTRSLVRGIHKHYRSNNAYSQHLSSLSSLVVIYFVVSKGALPWALRDLGRCLLGRENNSLQLSSCRPVQTLWRMHIRIFPRASRVNVRNRWSLLKKLFALFIKVSVNYWFNWILSRSWKLAPPKKPKSVLLASFYGVVQYCPHSAARKQALQASPGCFNPRFLWRIYVYKPHRSMQDHREVILYIWRHLVHQQ